MRQDGTPRMSSSIRHRRRGRVPRHREPVQADGRELDGATAHLRWSGVLLEAPVVPGWAGAHVHWCIRPGDVMIIRPIGRACGDPQNQLEAVSRISAGRGAADPVVEPSPPAHGKAQVPAPRLEVTSEPCLPAPRVSTGATVRLSLKRSGVRRADRLNGRLGRHRRSVRVRPCGGRTISSRAERRRSSRTVVAGARQSPHGDFAAVADVREDVAGLQVRTLEVRHPPDTIPPPALSEITTSG